MEVQIENQDTGERIIVTGDGFQTYTNEELGRVFKDYGDGRLYEYDDNGKLMETAWTWDNPKHTPGPWYVERLYDGESGDIAIIGNKTNGGLTGTIVTRTTSMGGETAEANAALIAAAPDMLAALKVVCYALAAVRDGEDDPKVWTLEELKYSVVDRIIEAAEPGFDDGITTLSEARDNIMIFAAALAKAEGK